jgi:hypothetical protein
MFSTNNGVDKNGGRTIRGSESHLNDYRQSDNNTFDTVACNTHDNTSSNRVGFKYMALLNRSVSMDSMDSEEIERKRQPLNSDQKLPSSGTRDCGYAFVNKNGQVRTKHFDQTDAKSQEQSTNNKDSFKNGLSMNRDPLLSNHLLVQNNKDKGQQFDELSISSGQKVPNQNGKTKSVIINTNHLVLDDTPPPPAADDITPESIKYLNFFSFLCCWCFPFTGILAVIYSRLTKQYFETRDMPRAKKYMNKTEWFLLLTVFFGLVTIGLILAYFETFRFKVQDKYPNSIFSHPIIHKRSLTA